MSRLEISLQRSACYGTCPDYSVTIAGDGTVTFTTRDATVDAVSAVHRSFSFDPGVVVRGKHVTHIKPAEVDQLVERLRQANFFGLKSEYRSQVTDNPTYVISVDTGSQSKRVVDYVGKEVGMPASVTALEDEIDKVARTAVWIEGQPEAIDLLIAEGARFDNEQGLLLMQAAAERNDVAMMQRLRSLGAPVHGVEGIKPLEQAIFGKKREAAGWLIAHGAIPNRTKLLSALLSAVDSDDQALVEQLLAHPSLGRLAADESTRLLRSAASNANLALARIFLAKGSRINGRPEDGPTEDAPLYAAAQGVMLNGNSRDVVERRAVVRLLLSAGADAAWSHPVFRESVLWSVEDAEIARMLIAAGADPNFKDPEGEPIIFSIDDEGVALAMIDAGLDLRSRRPADGKTLRGWAEYAKWPKVLKILTQRAQ